MEFPQSRGAHSRSLFRPSAAPSPSSPRPSRQSIDIQVALTRQRSAAGRRTVSYEHPPEAAPERAHNLAGQDEKTDLSLPREPETSFSSPRKTIPVAFLN